MIHQGIFGDGLHRGFEENGLILHGDDDQIVPIGASSGQMMKLVPNGTLKVYPWGAHGLSNVNHWEVSTDIFQFLVVNENEGRELFPKWSQRDSG